jgi:flagellar biosynthesis/type III secretory pathway chaperone
VNLTAEPAPDNLVRALALQRGTLQSLREVLESERRALVNCEPVGLESSSQRKLELLRQLEHQTRRWNALALQTGYVPEAATTSDWIETLHNAELRSAWTELKIIAHDVRVTNETNGKLIATQLNHFELQCSVLNSNGAQQDLYGADGASHRNPTLRTIAAA